MMCNDYDCMLNNIMKRYDFLKYILINILDLSTTQSLNYLKSLSCVNLCIQIRKIVRKFRYYNRFHQHS